MTGRDEPHIWPKISGVTKIDSGFPFRAIYSTRTRTVSDFVVLVVFVAAAFSLFLRLAELLSTSQRSMIAATGAANAHTPALIQYASAPAL